MHARTLELLDRNTRIRLDQPRHHVALAEFLIWDRQRSRCDADPARSDSLAALARKHFGRALSMRRDTTPQERITLASFDLGRGETGAAVAMTERALQELGDWRSPTGSSPPTAAANPFLAAGNAAAGVEIIEKSLSDYSASIEDPRDPDRSIDLFDSYHTLLALLALGTLGEAGPAVSDRLDRLRRVWDDAPLSAGDRVALRLASLDYTGPALVHTPDLWEEWFEGWNELGLEAPPVWRGIFAAHAAPPDPVAARESLDEAVAMLGSERAAGYVVASDLYLPLLLAQRLGATDVERELRERLRRCALKLDSLDPGWGMRHSLGDVDGFP
jgi:hypothetical protein